jgi:hypothetical protein
MTERIASRLVNPVQAHGWLTGTAWPSAKALLLAGHELHAELRTETRSTAQNRLMWSALGDLARQVEWHGQRLTADDWKAMCTAALKRQRVVPGLDGGFVVLGQSTSRMTRAEMTELIDFVHAFGAQRGVRWRPASVAEQTEDLR